MPAICAQESNAASHRLIPWVRVYYTIPLPWDTMAARGHSSNGNLFFTSLQKNGTIKTAKNITISWRPAFPKRLAKTGHAETFLKRGNFI